MTAVAPEARELMKGDPLRGVHAFYGASAREWWAPLRPSARVTGATPSSACWTSRASSPSGRSTSGPARCSARRAGPLLSAQYRLMIRTERDRARQARKYDEVELAPYTDGQIAEIEAQYAAEGRGRRTPAGGRTSPSATRSGPW